MLHIVTCNLTRFWLGTLPSSRTLQPGSPNCLNLTRYRRAQSLGINSVPRSFSPQACGHCERINLVLLPPQPLIAGCMVLLMVDGTERYREFVADLEPKALGLGEADVMGVARRSPANETGLLGHEAQMLLGSDPFWFADGEHALVDLGAGTVMGCLV